MHTCEVFDLERHLAGRSAAVVATYHVLAGAVADLGEVEIVPMKSSILFRVQTAFVSVVIRRKWVDVYFSLARKNESPRTRSIVRASAGRFVHRVRLDSPDDIDEEMKGWLSEARTLSM